MAETVRKLDWVQVHVDESMETDSVTAQYTIITPGGDVKRIITMDPADIPDITPTNLHTMLAGVIAATLV